MTTTPVFPLSLSQKDFSSPWGNVNASVRFKGELSVPALRRALAFVTRRHEGLRIRIVRSDDQVRQWIAEAIDSWYLPVIKLDNFAAAEARIAARLRDPTDLDAHGPVNAELLNVGPNDHVLLLVIHTIAVDRYSLVLLLKELVTSYDCYARDREPSLPWPMRYTDYVLSDALCGDRLNAGQLEHWRSVLSGSRDPIPRRENSSSRVAPTWRFAASSITSAEAQRVQEFAAAANTSLSAALYAAMFLAVSARYSVDDIIATVCYSGRDTRELQTLGAKTARRFPIRVFVRSDMSLAEVARNLQSAYVRGAMASRAPFTLARAAAQVGETSPEAAAGANARQRVPLVIVDQETPTQEIGITMPRLSAERILMGRRPYDGLASDAASSRDEDVLMISLLRDSTMVTRRPVVFVAAFLDRIVDQLGVRRLLDTIWAIARLSCRENLNLTVADLFARVRSPRDDELRSAGGT